MLMVFSGGVRVRNCSPLGEHLASVAPNVICVSTIVRPPIAIVSHNVIRNMAFIAVPSEHHCKPLQIGSRPVDELSTWPQTSAYSHQVCEKLRKDTSISHVLERQSRRIIKPIQPLPNPTAQDVTVFAIDLRAVIAAACIE